MSGLHRLNFIALGFIDAYGNRIPHRLSLANGLTFTFMLADLS